MMSLYRPTDSSILATVKIRKCKARFGFSLLEVIGAIACVSIVMIPTAKTLSEANTWASRIETQQELRLLSEGVFQQFARSELQDFVEKSEDGTFGSEGRPDCFYFLKSYYTDRTSYGDQLLTIDCFSFHDVNGNKAFDRGELSYQFYEQIARRK